MHFWEGTFCGACCAALLEPGISLGALQEEDGMGAIAGALELLEVEEATQHRDKLRCIF